MLQIPETNSGRPLEGKVAIITGGSRGIGLASACALGRAGAQVNLWDVIDATAALEHLTSLDIVATARQVNVADRRQVHEAVAAIPGGRLDILVTAAGIIGSAVDVEAVDEDEFDRVLAVNLKGTFWPIQAALPAMRKHGGKIVCIGSLAGEIGSILSGAPYTASKGGVHAMVKWIAKHAAAEGIYANVIAPGIVETEMVKEKNPSADYCPLGRLGTGEDIANAVLFLASPSSNYITGTVLNVNGGFFMG
jgi:3-oxoacyl-[acyl-carrier protein] reductase